MYSNVDSLLNKKQELEIVLKSFKIKPPIILLTEVNYKNKDINYEINELNIPGYTMYHNIQNKGERGVATYVSTDLESIFLKSASGGPEFVFIKLELHKGHYITVANIYRSPNSTQADDIKLCNDLECLVADVKKDIIIVGDFNFPEIDWDLHYSTNKSFGSTVFLNTLHKLLLQQHVNFPTRSRGNDTPHILDLVITDSQLIHNIDTLAPLGKSDHVVLMIETNFFSVKPPIEQKLNYDKGDYAALRSYLDCDWDKHFDAVALDVDEMWNIFKTKIDSGVTQFIPLTSRFHSTKWKRPLKVEIRNQIRSKKSLWRKYIRNKDNVSWLDYASQRNKVKNIIRNDLIEEQNTIAQHYKSNPKKFWKYVSFKTKHTEKVGDLKLKNEKGDTVICSSAKAKADSLCKFFSTVFCNERDECFDALDDRIIFKEFTPVRVTEDDVLERLSRLNISKSEGPDLLHPRVVYEIRHEIKYPLTKIFNRSLETRKVPEIWKCANIVPIYKKGNKDEVNNYRPVSLTCIICKILESIIRDSIMEHFTANKLFTNRQFGFLKGRSTVTQLLQILDEWTEALETGGRIDVIYTDFEKAFDKVPHKRLLSKLRSYRIDNSIVEWIKSFLTDRKQRVRVNGEFSCWAEVLSGIPQGSILGPLLFIIFINDLVDICTDNIKMFLFADDAKMYCHVRDIVDKDKLQSGIDKFVKWTDKWQVKLNIDKCKVISIHHRRYLKTSVVPSYVMNDTVLEEVEEIKDLGVHYDTLLLFDKHVSEKVKKAYSMLGIIKRNFAYISRNCFVILYKSLVRSHLEYANSVWYPKRKTDIDKLERVQKRATKLIPELSNKSYSNRLKSLNLPTLKYRRHRGDMIELFKIIKGIYDPSCVPHIDLLEFAEDSIRTRGNKYKLTQHHCHYDLRKYNFTNRVIPIWNSLPNHVVSAETVNTFKQRLDKFWIDQDVMYNYKADLHGIGNRSIIV